MVDVPASLQDGIDYNVIIKTPCFVLSPLCIEDTGQFYKICSKRGFTHPSIHRYKQTQHLPLEARIDAFIQRGCDAGAGLRGRTLFQAIRPQGQDQIIGASLLLPVAKENRLFEGADPDREWEIGYFTDVDHQGQGVASESISHMIQYAVDHWGLTGLWASIEPSRKASLAIAEKLGLTFIKSIPAGADFVPYLDDNGQSAARKVYRTPADWVWI